MGKPSNKLRRFVALYTDSSLKGKWAECAVAADLDPAPDPTDAMVRNMIEKAGGEPAPEPTAGEQADDAIAELLAANESGIPWGQLRDKLTDVIGAVATGKTRATAAQVSMLKYIVEQAKEAGANAAVQNVILLPTQGAGASLRLDELMRLQLREREAKVESAN